MTSQVSPTIGKLAGSLPDTLQDTPVEAPPMLVTKKTNPRGAPEAGGGGSIVPCAAQKWRMFGLISSNPIAASALASGGGGFMSGGGGFMSGGGGFVSGGGGFVSGSGTSASGGGGGGGP